MPTVPPRIVLHADSISTALAPNGAEGQLADRSAEKVGANGLDRVRADAPEEADDEIADDGGARPFDVYFRELGRLRVLRPREEFARARRIETLEVAAWERVLAEPAAVRAVVAVVERTLGGPPLELAAPRASRGTRRRPSMVAAARALRRRDADKLAFEAMLAAIRAGEVAPRATRWRRAVDEAAAEALRAKNEFVLANLRLVITVARRYDFGYLPLADLVQEGNIGLLKAVDRFDHRRGYRFSTYATWWIRHAIVRAIADKGRTIRVPVHMLDARHRVANKERDLQRRLGRAPSSDELQEATGIGAEKLARIGSARLDRPVSLDRPIGGDEDDRRLLDLLRDPAAEEHGPPDEMARLALVQAVRAELDRLKPIEAEVIRQRFGLGDSDEERTLKAIGDRYSLSRERIRQIQAQALQRLRAALDRRGFA